MLHFSAESFIQQIFAEWDGQGCCLLFYFVLFCGRAVSVG